MGQNRDARSLRPAEERRGGVKAGAPKREAERAAGRRGRVREVRHAVRAHAPREQEPGHLVLRPLRRARREAAEPHPAAASPGRGHSAIRSARAGNAGDGEARVAAAASGEDRYRDERDERARGPSEAARAATTAITRRRPGRRREDPFTGATAGCGSCLLTWASGNGSRARRMHPHVYGAERQSVTPAARHRRVAAAGDAYRTPGGCVESALRSRARRVQSPTASVTFRDVPL